jgi:hypothetical protein
LPLLPDDPPENVFQRPVLPGDVLAEGLVDQGLVVPAALFLDLGSEPFQDVPVQADGDSFFGVSGGEWRASPASLEIISLLHIVSPWNGWLFAYDSVVVFLGMERVLGNWQFLKKIFRKLLSVV